LDDDDFYPEFDDRMDIDIPEPIPGVTLNGGPIFEDDFAS